MSTIESDLDHRELEWHKDEAYRWRICAVSKEQQLNEARAELAKAKRISRYFLGACAVLSLWAAVRDWASLVQLVKRIWP